VKIFTDTKEISDEDDDEVVELVRLTNINVVANGIVDRAANRATFFALKRDSGMEDKTKQAPSEGMSNEALHAAQEERSKKYGIEILDGASLTFPKDYPTELDKYGDPVNLAYPVDTEGRARNARVRFKQNYSQYSEEKSRNVVHERIVRAELSMGIKPDFNPDDKLDAALPSDLKEKMQDAGKAGAMTEDKSEDKSEKAQTNRQMARDLIWSVMNEIDGGALDSEEEKQTRDAIVSAIRELLAKKLEGMEKAEDEGGESQDEPPADTPAETQELPSDQELESEQMASEKADHDARGEARQVLYSALDEINNGAVDTEEEKQTRGAIISTIRAFIGQKLDDPSSDGGGQPAEGDTPQEPESMACGDDSRKAGRPQFSKARVAKIKEAVATLNKMLDDIGEMVSDQASQKSDDKPVQEPELNPDDEMLKEVESLKSQIDSMKDDLSQKSSEIESLKTQLGEASRKAQQAAPPATFDVDGRRADIKPSEPKKRVNPLNMRLGRD
jgi:hypothetical protein